MVEPPELSNVPRGTVPPPPEPPARRIHVARRRFVALAVIAAAVAVGAWAAVAAIDKGSKQKPAAAPRRTTGVRALKTFRIIFPEGFTRLQMAQRIKAVDAIARRKRHFNPKLTARTYEAATASSRLPARLAGDKKRRNLEGMLFPAEYELYQNDVAKTLVAKQLAAFRDAWSHVRLGYARSKNLSGYDVLTIASMIEKEAVVDSERPLIAAVIYNRLHARMPLGIDATLRYGLNVPGTKPLTKSDLANPTPYNTRLHLGLPPTPISNPGLPSLVAAAHPAKVNYLYFVAKPDKKHHFFTASAREFEQYLASHGYGPHP